MSTQQQVFSNRAVGASFAWLKLQLLAAGEQAYIHTAPELLQMQQTHQGLGNGHNLQCINITMNAAT